MRFNKLLLILPVMMMGFATTNAMAKGCVLDTSCSGRDDDYLVPQGGGGCYECDKDACRTGTQLTVFNASLEGQQYNGWQAFVCSTGGNDLWKKVPLPDCTDDLHSRLKNSRNTKRAPWNPNEPGESQNNQESYVFIGADVCLTWVCLSGYEEVVSADGTEAECVIKGKKVKPEPDPKPNPDPKPKPNPAPNPNPNPSGCRASRMGNAIGMACCDLKSSEAKWDGSSCNCVDATKEFKINAKGKGECVAKTETVVPAACNCSVDLTLVANAESSCAAKSMASAINMVKVECGKGAGCNGQTVSVYVNAIAEAMNSCSAPVEDESNVNTKRLAEAVAALDKYRSGLDVSVWKDAEGNFNTARLVSDSIAGVVLGTAGGLITSSVVKKNQVKSGFEDVVCTIGGQEVGSYGDEISVGIQ